ncbi:hypothetical protein CEUSTIGMA_g4831.t1 [Chlamydomonas eustigma]|uniref:Importin N-terminal domain-containing protein n=1 Tax=Chlamydomonas eustigma TaxID=1157962 RepID=A0A250X2V3_9CHLO|nr:hypothetical protein CEUSTIGMA_g4831.t1 [Chlamydomonas eustigma]|eukprot:GAX77385.1 hypothetical protein CEUSTIGMA_g4831.t1 [Chlamydomonas eustigma]
MAQQLLSALSALYHNQDVKIKDEADRYLEAWQQSPEAWSIADAILHDPSQGMEAQYFCAQTLRTKVQRDFEELPDGAVESLRDSLLALLLKYSKGSPPVRTQLALALAAMSVHVPSGRWGEGGPVKWLTDKLLSSPSGSTLPCLLELLIVLPQEANSQKVAVRPERRRQHAQELTGAVGLALDILTKCLSQPGDLTNEHVLEAFGSWLKLSCGKGLSVSTLFTHPLTAAALSGLGSSTTFHASVDAVCELVWVTVDPETASIHDEMMPLIQQLVPAVMQLRPRFAVASRRFAEEAGLQAAAANNVRDEFDDDEDTAKGMARLFAEVGEAYIFLIATAVKEVWSPVEAMLEVAAFPDFSIASISFNFWTKLSRQVQMDSKRPLHQHHNGSGVASSSMPSTRFSAPSSDLDPERVRRAQFFRPAFEKLVTVVRGKVRYPEQWSAWSKEQHADFKRQRLDISDVIEDAVGVLGFSLCLDLLLEPLKSVSADMAGGKPFDWRAAEAALYCIRAISNFAVTPAAGSPLLSLLEALPGLPSQEPQLQYTVCQVVAQYAPWLGEALSAGLGSADLAPRLLQMSVGALQKTESAGAGARSLMGLCEHCCPRLGPCLEALVSLYRSVLRAGSCSTMPGKPQDATDRLVAGALEPDVHVAMKAVCTATGKLLPPESLAAAARELQKPVLELLQEIISQHNLPAAQQPNAATTYTSSLTTSNRQSPYLVPLMDRLSTVLTGFQQPNVVADLLGCSWPLLDVLMARCTSVDVNIMERACRALRFGVKVAGMASAPLLPTLLEVLPRLFNQTRHSAILYILSEVIKVFGDQPGRDAQLAPVLQQLVTSACTALPGLKQAGQEPELADDTLLLVTRALGYCPRIVLHTQGTILDSVMNLAMVCTLLQHREACCSALSFLCRLMDPRVIQSCNAEALQIRQNAVRSRGPMLLRLLLAGVAGCVPSSRIKEISSAILALLKAEGQLCLQWIGQALTMLPDSAVAPSDKQALMGAVSNIVSNGLMGRDLSVLDAALEEFGELCRRTHRVMHAAQRALLPPELHPEFMLI